MLISSAIKFKRNGNKYFHVMCGKRHGDIYEEMFHLGIQYDKLTCEQGFMTDDFRFLERHEAVEEAIKCHQVPDDFSGYYIYSEDIWSE